MKKVLSFGTFDLFHEGHKNFLEQAKSMGDKLYICVARDINVKKYKHKISSWNENKRKEIVEDSCPEAVVSLGYVKDVYQCLSDIKPDIIALGYDQTVFIDGLENEIRKRGLDSCEIVRLKPFEPEKYKTSLIEKN